MKINDKMQYYIEQALDEQYDRDYPSGFTHAERDSFKRLLMRSILPNNFMLRALELACEDIAEDWIDYD